jgi:hypothetical protein
LPGKSVVDSGVRPPIRKVAALTVKVCLPFFEELALMELTLLSNVEG